MFSRLDRSAEIGADARLSRGLEAVERRFRERVRGRPAGRRGRQLDLDVREERHLRVRGAEQPRAERGEPVDRLPRGFRE